jgi:hypothetical protein
VVMEHLLAAAATPEAPLWVTPTWALVFLQAARGLAWDLDGDTSVFYGGHN